MKIDRALQRELLTKLADLYPERDNYGDIYATCDNDDEAEKTIIANLLYLQAHELVEAGINQGLDGHYSSYGAKITAKGLDFLADDGGLSAILGVVTVRLHDDTLKALIETRIQQSDLPPPDKKRWTDALRSLPADAIKHLTLKLLDAGLTRAPDALQIIERFLQ